MLPECNWITTYCARHKRATWYYSFMGRKEDRDKFSKDKKERRGGFPRREEDD
ncbi:hypothetical protein ABVK25_005997 [Lepraria finkii]|uniref:Uncharacterized protein n=1 Tax=Lepraria finkii TaxID=1340010 RepID=A0ABR4BCQ0_9LECA